MKWLFDPRHQLYTTPQQRRRRWWLPLVALSAAATAAVVAAPFVGLLTPRELFGAVLLSIAAVCGLIIWRIR